MSDFSESTHDEFIKNMSPARKKKYDEGYYDFILSELLLALTEKDMPAIKELIAEAYKIQEELTIR